VNPEAAAVGWRISGRLWARVASRRWSAATPETSGSFEAASAAAAAANRTNAIGRAS
jgi:hypothetical protein